MKQHLLFFCVAYFILNIKTEIYISFHLINKMATGKKLFSLIAFVALFLTFFVHAEKTKDDKERQNSKYGTVCLVCRLNNL